MSSTLLLPGDEDPMTSGWEIKERLDHVIDAVVDSGECGEVPTTVVDFSGGEPVIRRIGAGDPRRFEDRPRGRQSLLSADSLCAASEPDLSDSDDPVRVVVGRLEVWP